MRKVTVIALLIMGAALLALLPAITIGQQGGGKKGGFGGGGFGGGINPGQDPDALFEVYAKGRSFIPLSEMARSRIGGTLTQYAQDNGITSGQITRQQFRDFFTFMNSKAGVTPGQTPPNQPAPGGLNPGGFNPGGGFPGGGFNKKKGPPGGGEAAMPAGDPTALYPYADAEFKKFDANGDNKLVPEEMPRSLKANLEKWDKNGDGFIDIVEYRAYYVARMQGNEDASITGAKGIASIIIDEEDLDRKPVVYRAGGKMPPGLPDWFLKLDTDKDGQVALYEWRVANKSLDDFKKWDLNDDGFITAEEAAKVQTLFARDNPAKGSLASASESGDEQRPARGMFGKDSGKTQWQGGGDGSNPFGGGKQKGKGKGGKGEKGSN
jgi:hypothetical protein